MKNELICRPVIIPAYLNIGPICKDSRGKLYLLQGDIQYHLYLVSDREIKKGDWFVRWCIGNAMLSIPGAWFLLQQTADKSHVTLIPKPVMKLVEGSTDKSLGLPLIPQSFVEKYVEAQGKIDKVKLEMRSYLPGIAIKSNEVIILPIKDSWNREEVKVIAKQAWNMPELPQITFDEWFDKQY